MINLWIVGIFLIQLHYLLQRFLIHGASVSLVQLRKVFLLGKIELHHLLVILDDGAENRFGKTRGRRARRGILQASMSFEMPTFLLPIVCGEGEFKLTIAVAAEGRSGNRRRM